MERVLGRIGQGLRLVVADVLDAEVLEDLKQRLAVVTERHCAVVREVLLDEHMAVEAAHFRDGEYADGTEGVGWYVQHFALCNVCAQLGVGRALETEERDVARGDVAFERALRNLNRQGSAP